MVYIHLISNINFILAVGTDKTLGNLEIPIENAVP